MRNYNTHLSDDSETTGLGLSVKTIGKAVDLAKRVMDPLVPGKPAETWGSDNLANYDQDTADIEYTQPSLTRLAKDMLLNGSGSAFNVTDAFWTTHPKAHEHMKQKRGNPDIVDGRVPEFIESDKFTQDYNIPIYALNNYNYKTAAPIFAKESGGRAMNGSMAHGYFSIFNPLSINNDYTAFANGAFHFRDTSFNGLGQYAQFADSCTIKDIVTNTRGRARYFYEDFMFCAELGKLSNNHLITLRKFSSPVLDNIFTATKREGDNAGVSDVGRLVCYFGGKDNKLEDIIKMDFKATWKEMEGKWQEQDTGTDNDSSGPLGILGNFLSPSYISGFLGGANSGRGLDLGPKWLNRLGADYRKVAYSHYDHEHTIYTPKNIVNKTHKYEGMMQFNNQFSLTFRYKMRSYNDINQKAAFLDLISNILNVTYRRATFWGGGVNWLGTPLNRKPFNIADNVLNKIFDKAGGIWNSLFSDGGINFFAGIGEFFGNFWENMENLVNSAVESAKNITQEAGNMAKSLLGLPSNAGAGEIVQKLGNNMLQIGKGMAKNRLGRPQVYALNALLNGAAVGPWHVTIGNPFNPIVVMGNLIIDKVEMQQLGPLNIDNFPEELVVKVTLKHAKPRDLTDISKMYTQGLGEISSALSKHTVEKIITGNNSLSEAQDYSATVFNATSRIAAEAATERKQAQAKKEQLQSSLNNNNNSTTTSGL